MVSRPKAETLRSAQSDMRVESGRGRFLSGISALFLWAACAGSQGGDPVSLPVYRDFGVGSARPYAIAVELLARLGGGMQIDPQLSTASTLVTTYRPVSLRQLKTWTASGHAPIRGRPLHARYRLQIKVGSLADRPDSARVMISPSYAVYISAFGDRRQWIEWPSNGRLEQTFLAALAVELGEQVP